jgi:glycosyltransferase involved in cell wall biosynthesis
MECEWLTQLDPALIAKRLDTVDLVIGCSDFITEQIRQRFPETSEKCKTLFNGVDVNHFCSPAGCKQTRRSRFRILYVGRISPEKGVHVLIEAFQEVIKCIPQAELVLVGAPGEAPYEYTIQVSRDRETCKLASFYHPITKRGWGNYMRFLKSQIPATLTRQICFIGAVSHADLVDFYRDATLFVFPSVWEEPFGIPLIEAMACQKPVIATRGGGIPEIIEDGVNGFLVERGKASDLAEAIIHLLEDEQMGEAMGNQGRVRVCELFSWDRIAETLLVEYQNARRLV